MKRGLSILVLVATAMLAACGGGASQSTVDQIEEQDTGGGSDINTDDIATDTAKDIPTEDVEADEVGSCTGTCDQEGKLECVGNSFHKCEDPDDDGCFDWSDLEACQAGTICKDGECVVSCPEQPCTVVGTHKCGEGNQVLECGDYNSDGCLEWGNPVQCAQGLTCSAGFCASTCTNECTVLGATKCEGNSIVTCGDYNTDGCLEWGDANPCGTQICSGGTCQSQCEPECTVVNSQICEGNGYKVCGSYDADPCLEWGSLVNCSPDQTCSNGYCLAECQPECSAVGARKCVLNAISTCNDYNSDGCLEWGTPLNCAEGLVCSNGYCVSQCENECTIALAKDCDEGGNVVVCNDYNLDGCLEWGSPTPCQNPYVCNQGNCMLDCNNQCEIVDSKICVTGATNQYKVCGEWDNDGCLEWGSPITCDNNLVCSNGNCAMNCQNECTVVNQTKCNESFTAVQTCDDYNDDGCLEWGTPAYCEAWQACEGGLCEDQLAPVKILINEVVYDSVGTDTDVFVELRGPAGTDLSGFFLVGVNGNGGLDYNSITLTGSIPADGLFVVAHPSAIPAISDSANLLDAKVDYENAPDSIELRYGTQVVDAVGYGLFSGGAQFHGEGNPAVDVQAGHSLGRDAAGTDTDDNSVDFQEYNTSTPGAANVANNEPPVATLVCPPSGLIGDDLEFDASASNDPDGSIVSYSFDFGDGQTSEGAAAMASHVFNSAGTFSVTVTVEDDGGLTDEASCSISVGDANVPEVFIVKPVNNKQVTQGSVVQVLVDANPTPGRSISKVELLADGIPYGSADTQAPYEFSYTVPLQQPTNSVITLQAKATDNASSAGFSIVTSLQVKNDLPIPSFTAVVSGTLKVAMDASACFDTETPVEDLQVRWDFDNNGTWDTDWSTNKLIDHTYASDGSYTIKMAVMDGAGQTATTTRTVTLSSIQYVSGVVTTTAWTGTIVVTGDVTVPSGNTLTVTEGTSVLFSWNDQNSDQAGDWGILIQGTLLVQGSASKPVIFTALGNDHKSPRAWDSLHLQGSGHAINYAIFEYADSALDIRSAGSMSDSIVRFSKRGIDVFSGANFSLARCSVINHSDQGIHMENGTFSVDESEVLNNGTDGIYVSGGTLTLTDSTIEGNSNTGLRFFGGGSGAVYRNLITGNSWEGVRVETNGSSDPTPVIQYNNIFGNALVSARVVAPVNIFAYQNAYGTVTSAPWSTPAGQIVDWIQWDYSEYDPYSYYSGAVQGGPTGAVSLHSIYSSGTGWKDVRSGAVSQIRAQVYSSTSSSSYNATMAIHMAAYQKVGEVREMSVITMSHRLDSRHNYWGVFPNVLSVVSVAPIDSANLEGFVGIPFDSTWTKGIYYGGEAITTDTNWTSDVIITGQLDVTSDATLNLSPGVHVRFACIDSDGNGVGDCDMDVANSTLVANGTSTDPVYFTDWHAVQAPSAWYRIQAFGTGGVDLTHTVFEYGKIGLEVKNGLHSLDYVTFQNNATHGLNINGANGVTINGLVSRDNGTDGVHIEGSQNVSLNKAPGKVLTLDSNGRHGLYVYNSTTGMSLANADITDNVEAGVHLWNANVAISNCNIAHNLYGVVYTGSSAGSLSASNVKFNDREGFLLYTQSSNPNPGIHGNNIYGNSLVEGGAYEDPGLSVYQNAYGTVTDGPWATPDEQEIHFARVQYSEYDPYSYYSGLVAKGDGSGVSVYSTYSSAGPAFQDIRSAHTNSLAVTVYSSTSSSSYNGTMTVLGVFYYKDSSGGFVKELAEITDGGTVSCTDNYWGLGLDQLSQIPNRLTLGRPTAVDYSGYVGTEKSGTGPQ